VSRPSDDKTIDDKALEEYLKGGSPVSRRYREIEAAGVPPELDLRVLSEARSAVAGKRVAKSRAWLRWGAPLALAASAVLVVSIVIESGVQKGAMLSAPEPRSEVSAEAQAGAREKLQDQRQPEKKSDELRRDVASDMVMLQEVAQVASPPPPMAIASPVQDTTRVKAEQPGSESSARPVEQVVVTRESPRPAMMTSQSAIVAVEQETAPPETESVAPADAPPAYAPAARTEPQRRTERRSASVEEVVLTAQRRPTARVRNAGPRGTVPMSGRTGSAADEADLDEAQSTTDPQRWLEEIRELRNQGKSREADREWRRFRDAFPDFPVAETDAARAPADER
jgi:hypothetical protein